MSRLAPLDRAAVLVLVPLWLACFGLGVQTQVRGGGLASLGLSLEGPGSYPVLTGDFARLHSSDPLAQAGLRPGDSLLRLGQADLRGVGTLGFLARSLEEGRGDLAIPLSFGRDGEHLRTSLPLAPVSTLRASLAASLSLAASALFLLLRGRPTPTVRAYFYFAMCWAFTTSALPGGRPQVYAWIGLFVLGSSLLFPLALHLAFRFPDDRVLAGRAHAVWPWLFAVRGPFTALRFTSLMAIGQTGFTVTTALGVVAALGLATHKYRRADPVARRQMKWVLLGLYCASLPAVALAVSGTLFFASFWVVPLLPLALLVSVARYNLFDVDRVLSAAASYNILAVLLGAGVLVAVPLAADALSAFTGVDPGAGQVGLSLLLAAILVPAHRRLRPQIERVFFRERYALDRGIARLLPVLSACADTRELTERSGAELHRLLRPEACVVYARLEGSYVPVFAEGRAVPPAFEADGPLLAALRERRAPLLLSDAGRRPDDAPLGPFDRAALAALRAEVVVPVRGDDELVAFLCLGPKRSGDVYTSTDLSLLAAVAETVSRELRRFDQEETIREAREMQESLRRYVPGAVAEQLASGAELRSGEREVSVLFVDLRGYTGFAESRSAEEIFSTVNRYTETVSQVVRKHGGSVVEFNGDGMMAVFGAPRELPHKERAAVRAGREIAEAVGALAVQDARGGPAKLSVGVGIATGKAFVGNIRAVDRMIWSAIGNTTNLAARLQGLARDLDASLVIDGTTRERARPAAADFEKRSAVPIPGRREAQDVYALPTDPDA